MYIKSIPVGVTILEIYWEAKFFFGNTYFYGNRTFKLKLNGRLVNL